MLCPVPPRPHQSTVVAQVEVRRCRRLQGEQPEYNEEMLADKALGIDRCGWAACGAAGNKHALRPAAASVLARCLKAQHLRSSQYALSAPFPMHSGWTSSAAHVAAVWA